MSKYPLLTDNKFYDKINKIYKDYKIPKSKDTINTYCKPKAFKLQYPQEFVSQYINPKTPYKSLLIYHKIGAGKTCASIQIGEKWKHLKRIVVVLPASLKGGYMSELRGSCGKYLKEDEKKQLTKYLPYDKEYIKIIDRANERIEEYYDIYSYNKFIELTKEGKMKLNNCILIIDEIQNMVSEDGTYYDELYNLIHNGKNKDLRVILMSATPMFDKPIEIALTMNLLNPSPNFSIEKFNKTFIEERKVGDKIHYNCKNLDLFKKMIKGYVSYFGGAPPYTFPEMSVRYVECEMSDFQMSVYKKVIKEDSDNHNLSHSMSTNASDLPNNFYIGARYTSNIVYPNKKINDDGLESLTDNKILNDLQKYSCKMDKMMTSIKRTKGKIFIYSGFKEHAGLKTIIRILEAFGYKNYKDNGTGKKRFAIWSGDETMKFKDEIRDVYNRHDNSYGNKLKIILGSPSIKEGVTLKAVRAVHVLEPYWNQSRLEQVIGRANRFCSHIELLEEERNVKVYIYIATYPDIKISVDQYIKNLSEQKNKMVKQFEKAIKEASIDCELNDIYNELKCVKE